MQYMVWEQYLDMIKQKESRLRPWKMGVQWYLAKGISYFSKPILLGEDFVNWISNIVCSLGNKINPSTRPHHTEKITYFCVTCRQMMLPLSSSVNTRVAVHSCGRRRSLEFSPWKSAISLSCTFNGRESWSLDFGFQTREERRRGLSCHDIDPVLPWYFSFITKVLYQEMKLWLS